MINSKQDQAGDQYNIGRFYKILNIEDLLNSPPSCQPNKCLLYSTYICSYPTALLSLVKVCDFTYGHSCICLVQYVCVCVCVCVCLCLCVYHMGDLPWQPYDISLCSIKCEQRECVSGEQTANFPWDLEGKQETQTQLRVKGGSEWGQRHDLDCPFYRIQFSFLPWFYIISVQSYLLCNVNSV